MPVEESPPPPVEVSPPLASGLRRGLFLLGGLVCVGMAYLGVMLPGLPTTPWVLLASYCFSRSSRRFHRWLRRSPAFGRLIHDWELHGGISRPVKVIAVGMIIVVVSLSLLSGRLPEWARWVVGGCAICGLSTIVFVVPTVGPAARRPPQVDRSSDDAPA